MEKTKKRNGDEIEKCDFAYKKTFSSKLRWIRKHLKRQREEKRKKEIINK